MPKYRLDQIRIGDEIYYEDKYVSKRHPSWKVVNKLDKSILIIETTDSKNNQTIKRMIDFMDVKVFELLPQNGRYLR
ncbi:hypothetical protein [Ferruginibacter albus]|uniref:hypothetical protein n=1 Tax=Ferruginibacter albus TaxID=2875540 RepID=UPI001CC5890D|nr:hypothetical protein [Ferruginibacter albus]UAY51004.1 hypothetical protein K9M53_10430 [Ferruginibacter albus]